MNERRLAELMRSEPVPGAAGAEERGRQLVERAYAARRVDERAVLPRLAVALAASALLVAVLLTPAGAAMRGWVDDVFSSTVREAESTLSELPGGGRLLVQSKQGPWVVQADGARRLLGRYAGAAWSPHGLFVAAARARSLSALEPDGTPHWSITAAAPIRDPRWSPSGFRIAYRAGGALRVLHADGTADHSVDAAAAPIAPAWYPPGVHLLAYVDSGGRLRIVDADTGRSAATALAASGATGLGWSADGSELVQATPHAVWLRQVERRKLSEGVALGAARRLSLPAGAEVRGASFSPRGNALAILIHRRRRSAIPRSEVLLSSPAEGSPRQLFAISGRLSNLTWSPDGRRLLLAWPDADEWLFLPLRDPSRAEAIGGIAAAFAPGNGRSAPFPRVEGWCCR